MSAPLPPASGSGSAAGTPAHRRRVRIFVGLHLAAVGLLYALAWHLGGGHGGAGAHPADVVATGAVPAAPAPRPAAPVGVAHDTATTTALPTWTQRAEVAAPWDQR